MYGVNPDGSQASSVGLAQQKRLAMKEKATIYSDDTKQTELCNFHAEKMMDIHGRYFVEDPQGNLLGMFKKEFAASLLNSTWKILDSKGNEILIIKESIATLAFLRRFVAYIPFVGEVADGLMAFLKYHFMFIDVSTQNKVAPFMLIKNTTTSPTIPLVISGGWGVDANTGQSIDLVDTTGGTIFNAPDHIVPFATGSGVTPGDIVAIRAGLATSAELADTEDAIISEIDDISGGLTPEEHTQLMKSLTTGKFIALK